MDQLLFKGAVLGLALLCFAWTGRSVRKERESQARHTGAGRRRAGRDA